MNNVRRFDLRLYEELLRKDELTPDEYELFKTLYHMEEEATSIKYDKEPDD